MSSIVDWNGDAFSYAFDCTGDVAWLLETPANQAPSIIPCQGSSGSVPTSPTPPSGTTYLLTSYSYSSGTSGNLLSSKVTSAVTHTGSTSLLEFDSLTYDDNNNLTSSTPKVSGATETADTYGYDSQQRVSSGPETSGSKTAYSYVNTSPRSTCSQPYCSNATMDQMGIDAMPEPGSTAQLGAEYSGNGELCWVGEVTSTTGSCSTPSATNYETMTYSSSGDLTGTTSHTYGSNSAMTWNVDANEPTCINPSGTSCTGPSSSQPLAVAYTYSASGMRTTAQAWDSGTSAVITIDYTWNVTSSALLSDGTFDYIYGLDSNQPISQIGASGSVTDELLLDSSSNVRGVVEVTSSAANPFVLDTYADYDSYGNPISANGGTISPGGLTVEGITGDANSYTRFGFGGGYVDTTGLLYLVNRYYEASLGQFLSVDSELMSTSTPYAYASDNPLQFRDALGTKACRPDKTWLQKTMSCYRLSTHGAYVTSKPSGIDQAYIKATGLLLRAAVVWEIGITGPPGTRLLNLIKSAGVDRSSGTLSVANNPNDQFGSSGGYTGVALTTVIDDYPNAQLGGYDCPQDATFIKHHLKGCILGNGDFLENVHEDVFRSGIYRIAVSSSLLYQAPNESTTGWIHQNWECVADLVDLPDALNPTSPNPAGVISTVADCIK